jgi:hypothetical protein
VFIFNKILKVIFFSLSILLSKGLFAQEADCNNPKSIMERNICKNFPGAPIPQSKNDGAKISEAAIGISKSITIEKPQRSVLSWEGPPLLADDVYKSFVSSPLSAVDLKGIKIGMSREEVEQRLGFALAEIQEKSTWSSKNDYKIYQCSSYKGVLKRTFQSRKLNYALTAHHDKACQDGNYTLAGVPVVDLSFTFIRGRLAVARFSIFADKEEAAIAQAIKDKFGGGEEGEYISKIDELYKNAFSKFMRIDSVRYKIENPTTDRANNLRDKFVAEFFFNWDESKGQSNDFTGQRWLLIKNWSPVKGGFILRNENQSSAFAVIQTGLSSATIFDPQQKRFIPDPSFGFWLTFSTEEAMSSFIALRNKYMGELSDAFRKKQAGEANKIKSDL